MKPLDDSREGAHPESGKEVFMEFIPGDVCEGRKPQESEEILWVNFFEIF